MKLADLHIHTFFSDSTSSPEEVVEDAKQKNLNCIAITDHDTTDGIKPTQEAAKKSGLEVLPGIELSSEIHEKDIHILGYLMDFEDEKLQSELLKMQDARQRRVETMILKLKTQGINNIEPEEVFSLVRSKAVGRVHLATILKQKGHVHTIGQAFEKFIGEGCAAYVKKFKITPFEAIALIRKFNGVAVLAHPMLNGKDELIPSFAEAGLQGIEVYYPNISETTMRYYEGIAKKHNLIATGGSDGHGRAKTSTFIGKIKIPYEIVEKLKSARGK